MRCMATRYAKLQMFLGTREDEVKSRSLSTCKVTFAMCRLLSQWHKWSRKRTGKKGKKREKKFVRFLGFSEYNVSGTM